MSRPDPAGHLALGGESPGLGGQQTVGAAQLFSPLLPTDS